MVGGNHLPSSARSPAFSTPLIRTFASAPVQQAASSAAGALAVKPAGRAAAILCGLGGAVPFLVFSSPGYELARQLTREHLGEDLPLTAYQATRVQAAYGASILSFLGGVHWGAALASASSNHDIPCRCLMFFWVVLPCIVCRSMFFLSTFLAITSANARALSYCTASLLYDVHRCYPARLGITCEHVLTVTPDVRFPNPQALLRRVRRMSPGTCGV